MTEKQLRTKVTNIFKGWLGCKEADGSHKKIIDIYNSHKPLARGYKLKYTDSWCAGSVSAAFIQAGLEDIFPLEVGCPAMIAKAKKMGIWVEDDAYTPSMGDGIMYDWQDTGKGDDVGEPDHVGLVVSVSKGVLKVIEGNKHDEVAYRTIPVDGRYIRGYITPNFASKATKKKASEKKVTTATDSSVKKESAGYKARVTDKRGLYIRKGTSKDTKAVGILMYGDAVTVTKEKNGWGYMGKGWICLKYTKRV